MPIQPNFLERTAIFNLNLVPGVLLDLGGALAFQTLHLAAQLGLFAVLAERPYTPTELAQKLHTHERGTESLAAGVGGDWLCGGAGRPLRTTRL
jgi:hypothetical protein